MKQYKFMDILVPYEGRIIGICKPENKNPWHLYWEYATLDAHRMKHHRKLITKYADFDSIMWTLSQAMTNSRIERIPLWQALDAYRAEWERIKKE